MTYSNKDVENLSLPLLITQTSCQIAQQFAEQQPNPQKAEQVYLNTLAVCTVNDYLEWVGIATDSKAGDIWNPVMRLCADVADLEVTGIGRLECRPMKTHQQVCYVPPEVWEERIGYVVVQIDESFREATLLGFTNTVASSELNIRQLQPLENLLERLSQLRQLEKVLVNLHQWFQNMFETGWQTVEALFEPAQASLDFSFRSVDSVEDGLGAEATVRRGKLIDLGILLSGYALALVVELKPKSEDKIGVLLQVHPTRSHTFLPHDLQLTVLDESGKIFLEARSRHADNYIQLQFSGKHGERFSAKVALEDASAVENFAL